MSFAAVLFDFDGVIADSEVAANRLLSEGLTEAGMPTSQAECYALYMGLSWAGCEAAIERHWGRPPPAGFRARRRAAWVSGRYGAIDAVAGAVDFVRALALPRAIASSSSPEWIEASLERIGLRDAFGPNISSGAAHVARGKPHPDVYVHAAGRLGVAVTDCLVIEDTVTGATAGLAAGATVVGLLAGGHMADAGFRAAHADRLRAAGVAHVFERYAALADWLSSHSSTVSGSLTS